MTYDLDLQPKASQGQGRPLCRISRSKVKRFKQESAHRQMDGHTHTHTHMDATESIIAFATRSIKMTTQHANTAAQWVVVVKFKMFQLTISLYYVGSWSRRLNHCLCFMHLAVSNHSSASVIVANTIWFCYGDDGYISYLATPTATFQPIAASDR